MGLLAYNACATRGVREVNSKAALDRSLAGALQGLPIWYLFLEGSSGFTLSTSVGLLFSLASGFQEREGRRNGGKRLGVHL